MVKNIIRLKLAKWGRLIEVFRFNWDKFSWPFHLLSLKCSPSIIELPKNQKHPPSNLDFNWLKTFSYILYTKICKDLTGKVVSDLKRIFINVRYRRGSDFLMVWHEFQAFLTFRHYFRLYFLICHDQIILFVPEFWFCLFLLLLFQ